MHTTQLAAGAALAVSLLWAVETRTWKQSDQQDFEKGKLENLSLRSDGRLTLAPAVTTLLETDVPYLWALAADGKGKIYAGGGGPGASSAKVFVIEGEGKSRVLAELPGLQIQAIALDPAGQVYAATAPDGRVYRLRGSKPEPFYSPGQKYIWAMVFDRQGNLYLATGDQGEIHRVGRDGKGRVFFRTEETHARSLALDTQGNLIVGTEPGGLIMRISPAGQGFVLYQTPKREVTALAVAADGTIWAAAVGNKAQPASPVLTLTPAVATPAPSSGPPAGPPSGGQRTAPTPATPPLVAPPPMTVSGGSEVYRIDPDNYPRRAWSHAQDIVYALTLNSAGKPLIGTGNKGHLYRIEDDYTFTLLTSVAPAQITAFAWGPLGALYAATGNVGAVQKIGPQAAARGTFESEAFDAGAFSSWGRLRCEASGGEALRLETRSGNLDRPQNNWSPWAPLTGAGQVASPPARFLQYRVVFDGASGRSPEVRAVEIAYLQKNVAPAIEAVEIIVPNYRFPAPSVPTPGPAPRASLTLPPLGQRRSESSLTLESTSSQSLTYSKGWMSVRWSASDPNNDTLAFRVEIRGDKEKSWKLLRDQIREKYFSWDGAAFADGYYRLRIIATDAPSNPPDHALSAMRESEPFLIDNSAPAILSLSATRHGTAATVRWEVKDALSIIADVQYSLDGGEWKAVEPVTRLADAPHLEYMLQLSSLTPGEHSLAIRASDAHHNQTVASLLIE
jgi:sugar lactone lactonase YvrE